MNICELFLSIDGEGRRTGDTAIFIRKTQCNLRCSYCFGIKKGRKVPTVHRTMSSETVGKLSPTIDLDKVKVGDVLLTLDNNFNLAETTVKETHDRQVTEWYEFKLGKHTYFVTPEHPIFTTQGIKLAKDLQVGDTVVSVKGTQYLSYMATHANNQSNPINKLKQVNSTDWEKQGKQVSSTIQRKKLNGTYKSTWQLLSDKGKQELRQKIANSKLGSKNPNWKGGSKTPNYDSLKHAIKNGSITVSQLSDKTPDEDNASNLVVHHIDENRCNDSLDNLIIVTSREHNKIHQRGYNFGKADAANKTDLSTREQLYAFFNNNGTEVLSKKHVDITKNANYGRSYGPKPLHVYNLTCAPYNTYLLDNMWVHNCDSAYAFTDDEATDMSVDDIVSKCIEIGKGCKRVTFTGGEPLYCCTPQQEKETVALINALTSSGFEVNVETNGAIPLEKWLSCVRANGFFTMDWKSISSGMSKKMLMSNLHLLDENDVLKFVVGSVEDLNQMNQLLEIHAVKAKCYVSPVFGKIQPVDLVNYVIDNQLHNVRVQLQLHKYIWAPDKRGV